MIRQRLFILSLFGTAMFGVTLLYYFFPASEYDFYPGCFSFQFFHLLCPSCGAQRSFSALLQGRLVTALQFNLLLPVSIPVILVAFFRYLHNSFNEKKKPIFPFVHRTTPWVILITILAYTILRNIPSYPFQLLAP